jgi:hypothetical protein
VDSASIRRAKWAETSLLGALWGYAIDVSEAFRTVSLGTRVNKVKKREDRELHFHALG